MPKGLPRTVKDNIEKCRAAAIAAVDVYNRPGPRFRTAHYIVLIVMAWTALFHAIFYRKRKKPWYKKKGKHPKGDRYVRVEGEPKHWELSECLAQHFGGNNPPERKNLEFLIGLRNKIEHRHLPELDAGLYGECQAALLNLEELLASEFGARYGLAEQLAVSLQFTQLIPPEKKKAAKVLAGGAVKSVKEYVEKFRGGLPSSTLNSTKYSLSVFLVPKLANKKELADAAVEFIRVDEANKDELARLEKLNVLIKEKHIPIANLDLHKPKQVVAKVQRQIPYRFTVGSHTAAWHHFKVRPETGAAKPELTDSKYCVYDAAHKDYLYTDAWVDKLSKEVASARRVLTYLEDRRVLYNPYHVEVAEQCVQSVLDIRRFLTEVIGGLDAGSKLAEHLRGMRAACRAFLDATGPGGDRRPPIRSHWVGLESSFFTALGELRATIGFHVAAIAVMHGLDVEGDLSTILPAGVEKRDL